VRVTRASLDKQPHDVAAMFNPVADRYDMLSLGQDRRLRRAVLSAVDPRPPA
jgi:demethylmenaquinone methyltransferase / 2-methoxy-6-polyprenyl-1,4-benzoquinol methylase